MSIFIASMFRAVSLSVSPFETLLPVEENPSTSAESRRSASSKESRVRVEFSKNMFAMVFPCRGGTFLMGRSSTSRKETAVSRISWMSSRFIPSRPSRWRVESGMGSSVLLLLVGVHQKDGIFTVDVLHVNADRFAGGGRHVLPDIVRPDRELPVAPVDQHRELDAPRTAEIDQFVQRRA